FGGDGQADAAAGPGDQRRAAGELGGRGGGGRAHAARPYLGVPVMEATHTPGVEFGTHADAPEQGDLVWAAGTRQRAGGLAVPAGARVADVGWGTGEMTLRLARRVGRGGRVLAVDRETALLERVRQRAAAAGLGERVTTVLAAMEDLPGALPEPVALVW